MTLDHTVPRGDRTRYVFENTTRVPTLCFCHNRVSNHLARSVLCKMHHAVNANNLFDFCTGSAVHIAAEFNWGEGLAVQNVTVRDNVFHRCGFCSYGRTGGASAVSINVVSERPAAIGLYRQIAILNNTVHCPSDASCAFFVSNAADVLVKNNHCMGCDPIVHVQYSADVHTNCSTAYCQDEKLYNLYDMVRYLDHAMSCATICLREMIAVHRWINLWHKFLRSNSSIHMFYRIALTHDSITRVHLNIHPACYLGNQKRTKNIAETNDVYDVADG